MIVAAGTFLVVFLYCWMQGVMDDFISSSARFNTGHVKIMTLAYKELEQQVPNDLAILGVDELLEKLRDEEKDMVWTPRIRFGGLLDIPDEKGETRAQGPVMGLGVDLLGAKSPEIEIFNLKKALVKGKLPQNKNEILISEEFANTLGVELGETATLLGSTMNGSMTMHNFVVSGTVRFGIAGMDRGAIIADIDDVRAALDMQNGASEILGFAGDMMFAAKDTSDLTERFNEKHSRKDDEFSPVMITLREQSNLGEYLDLANFRVNIIYVIFVSVMSIVLWNSGLMNGLRRYGEIGVRLAMGELKGSIYRWMMIESVLIGIIGTIIGTALGVGVSYYFEYYGVDFSYLLKGSTIMMSGVMRARVNTLSYVIGFLPGLIAPIFGSAFAGIGIYKRQTSQLFKELEV
jgi:putative ABC transport system permease protein